MAYDRPRVFADDGLLSSSIPDTASLAPTRSVLDRFRYGVRRPIAQGSTSDLSKDAPTATSDFGSVSSQSTSHETGLKLRCLDINQTRSHVVLAGGKILKTVRVDNEPCCTEDFDLRASAVNYARSSPSTNVTSSRGAYRTHGGPDSASAQRDTFDIEDVAWSNNIFRDYIATAARSGRIMLYDMSRPGVEVGSLHEHFRQVHKVDFNPMEGACLLSGSQDGTVRLWDLRNYRKNAMVCTSMNTFPGRSEGVRHVKWSPRDTWSFAFGTDTGVIQRWDIRQTRSPVLKFSAHHQLCNSIDWHPDGKHLVSAGKDQNVKIWDISPDARGGAMYSLRTPREVQNVRWRPGCFVTNSQEQLGKQCTQFATSYRHLSVVHVWDLRRPFVPFREIHHRINSGTCDMLWRTRDLLWTVGPEGEFTQTDVLFAPKAIDRRPFSTISCTANGEIKFVTKRRGARNWTSRDIPSGSVTFGHDRRPSHVTGKLAFGRSPGDDSFDERFIEPYQKKRHTRAASIKSNKSFGSTPPSTEEMTRLVTTELKTTMDAYGTFAANQASKLSSLPGTLQPGVAAYLAQNYEFPPIYTEYDLSYVRNVHLLFERNAYHAQRASLYRDAQTWKLIGRQLSRELARRAEINRNARIGGSVTDQERMTDVKFQLSRQHRSKMKTLNHADRSAARTEAVKATENPSNTSTPLARPRGRPHSATNHDTDVPETVNLPPSLTSHLGLEKHTNKIEFTGGMNGEERIRAYKAPESSDSYNPISVDDPSASRPDRSLNDETQSPQREGIDVRPSLGRETSSDDFMIFSTSSDSQPRHVPSGSFLSDLSHSSGHEEGNDQFHSTEFSESKASTETGSSNSEPRVFREDIENFQDLLTNGNLPLDELMEQHAQQDRQGENVPSMPNVSSKKLSVVDFAPDSILNDTGDRSTVEVEAQSAEKENEYSCEGLRKTSSSAWASLGLRTTLTQSPTMLEDSGDVPGSDNVAYILSDYLTVEDDIALKEPLAVRASDMLTQLLQWYAARGDAQMASQLFLLTSPFLNSPGKASNNDHGSLDPILSAVYHDHLSSAPLSMSLEAVSSIVQEFLVPLCKLNLSPLFLESILATYHDQLLSLGQFNAAADLRRLAYPAFPAVFEQGLKDVETGTLCLGCNNPVNNPVNRMRCESCNKRQAACSVCQCQESPYEMPSGKKTSHSSKDRPDIPSQAVAGQPLPHLTSSAESSAAGRLHTTCLLCNHTTHTACAIVWFSDNVSPNTGSGGACPVEGCLCDCVRGFYRSHRLQQQEAFGKQKHKSSVSGSAGVRRDDWAVGESRAVGRVRGALRSTEAGDETTQSGEFVRGTRRGASGVLARHGRAMSDEGKKVRLVAPESQ